MLKKVFLSIFVALLIVLPPYYLVSSLVYRYHRSRLAPGYDLFSAPSSLPSLGKSYDRPDYGFQFNYPSGQLIEENKTITVSNHLLQVKLLNPSSDTEVMASAWLVTVWNRVVTDSQIVAHYYPDFPQIASNEVRLSGQKAAEFVFQGPVSPDSGTDLYRVYVLRSPYYTYSLTSPSCHRQIEPSCAAVLSSLRINRPRLP